MKILHTADWHIGKRLNGQSLIEDQIYVLKQLLNFLKENDVDAVVISGDLYDKKNPSQEAMNIVNYFLKEINLTLKQPLFLISGNHDSKPYINARSEWFLTDHFYVSTSIEESLTPISFGEVDFYLIPYIEIAEARHYFKDNSIQTFEDAYRKIIENMKSSFSTRKKILVGHLFVSGSEESDSEQKTTIGLSEEVPKSLFKGFDYTLLGHLHKHDALRDKHIFYSGSIMKYSFNERNHNKGFKLIDTKTNSVEFYPFELLHDLVYYKGSFKDIIHEKEVIEDKDAYIKFELTDMDGSTEPMAALKRLYKNTLVLSRQMNKKVSKNTTYDISKEDDSEIFNTFFKTFIGRQPNDYEFSTFNEHLRGVQDETD